MEPCGCRPSQRSPLGALGRTGRARTSNGARTTCARGSRHRPTPGPICSTSSLPFRCGVRRGAGAPDSATVRPGIGVGRSDERALPRILHLVFSDLRLCGNVLLLWGHHHAQCEENECYRSGLRLLGLFFRHIRVHTVLLHVTCGGLSGATDSVGLDPHYTRAGGGPTPWPIPEAPRAPSKHEALCFRHSAPCGGVWLFAFRLDEGMVFSQNHVMNGHALWHILTAVVLYMLFQFHSQFSYDSAPAQKRNKMFSPLPLRAVAV